MGEQIKRVMGSRMWQLGMFLILSFNYGMTLVYVATIKGHDPGPLQISLGFLAGLGAVVSGGASYINVKKEERQNGS